MTARTVVLAVLGVLAVTSAWAGEGSKAASAFDRDREAILAMAGPHRVDFSFHETVAVKPGYEHHEPYHTKAKELVEVVEDTGTRIVLQHVLVVEGDDGQDRVVKHWRQDWTYQDTDVLAFRGNRTWEHEARTPEQVAGTWTQAVYNVGDDPRYEAVGRWTHTGGRSAWESEPTWRPLPRREYTHRDDYHVLVARNRHTITPAGWVHEQDNYKLVLDDQGHPAEVLVHETGLNVYDRDATVDLSAGRRYWEQTAPYWAGVRAAWAEVLSSQPRVTLHAKVDGQRLHRVLFALADDVVNQGDLDAATHTADAKVRAFVVVDSH